MAERVEALAPAIQNYAWGSVSGLAGLLGRAASGKPEAEAWFGAHPTAPSHLGSQTLEQHIAADPQRALGTEVRKQFGDRLPFLVKLLSIAKPLSLQVHPDAAQAKAGFEREESAGLPRTDPRRNYRDASHKPELVLALTPFEALCGFRPVREMRGELASLNVPALRSMVQMLEGWPDPVGVNGVVHGLLGMPPDEKKRVMDEVTPKLIGTARALAAEYPGDVGALLSLLLNPVSLEPGEAMFMPAGNLHAYLKGDALEVMAASDNVLRGGLTPKHVDVPELLATLKYVLEPVPRVSPRREGNEDVWSVPAPEFQLSRFEVKGAYPLVRKGPEVLLCVQGSLTAPIGLGSGHALWLDAADTAVTLHGNATIFRIVVP